MDEFLLIDVPVPILVHCLEETLAKDSREVWKLRKSDKNPYIIKDYSIDSLSLFMAFICQIVVYILEVGNEDVFNKVFVLLEVELFQENFVEGLV